MLLNHQHVSRIPLQSGPENNKGKHTTCALGHTPLNNLKCSSALRIQGKLPVAQRYGFLAHPVFMVRTDTTFMQNMDQETSFELRSTNFGRVIHVLGICVAKGPSARGMKHSQKVSKLDLQAVKIQLGHFLGMFHV